MRAIFSVILATVFVSSTAPAWAASYILCERRAEITPANPTLSRSGDPCTGSVQLQGISYRCTQKGKVNGLRDDFLDDLRSNGRSYCQSYCAKRSNAKIKCRGVFTEPERCGFTVPTNEAERFGKEVAPCNPQCEGTAMAYCSIYKSSYLRVEPELLAGKSANCFCERAR